MRGRCLYLLLALAPLTAAAAESPVNVSGVRSPDLDLYYYNYLRFLVPRTVRTFANSLAWQKRMFGWTPSEPTTILLADFADIGGAAVSAAPRATMTFDVAPPTRAFETSAVAERMYSLMNHELIHIMQGDVATEQDRQWRRFFHGKVRAVPQNPETLLYSYLTIPRFTAPRWFTEGTAVFMETWMAGGLGRAQGGYDEMVFRAMVRDGARFHDPASLAALGTKVDFQGVANAYLYGTRFVTWLAYAYSPEKVVEWIRRDEGSERYFADQFRRVFGIALEDAWSRWVASEQEFQRANLALVRKFPVTPATPLVPKAMGSISRMHYDEASGTLYGAFRTPGAVENIGALSLRDGSVRTVTEIKGATYFRVTSFAYDPATATAFYTNNNYDFRDLLAVDMRTGDTRRLLREARIGELVFNPADRSLIGVRHEDGLATLVRVPFPYAEWKAIHEFPWEHVPTDLDVSPDGRLLSASVNDDKGEQYLRVWELDRVLDGDMRPLREFHFGQSVPENFAFSKDGRHLYGASYYTGVSNIFRCEVATGKIDAVTNAETGFFRPVPLADGRLVALTYTAEGFVPVMLEPRPLADVSAIRFLGAELAQKHPVVKDWQVPDPNAIDDTKLVGPPAPYFPLGSVGLVNAYPVLQGYENSVGFGARFNMEDPLLFASLSVTASWTPDGDLPGSERGHVNVEGRYRGWRGAFYWNRTDFYDLFGPVKRSRKGFAATLGRNWSLVSDDPRKLEFVLDVGWYDRIDRLPWAQNVATDFSRLVVAEAGVRFQELRKSLGAIEDEKGVTASLIAQGSRAVGETTPQLRGHVDWGIALPQPHASVWLRSAAGIGDGGGNPTLANFYFGGFGNNYVDSGTVKRYRDVGAFPGFGIEQIAARRYFREMVEWNMPPLLIENAGTPGFHASALRPSVFAAGLWTSPGHGAPSRRFASVGGQLDLALGVLHKYEMTLSAGYAVGFESGRRAGSEWMVSLKIM